MQQRKRHPLSTIIFGIVFVFVGVSLINKVDNGLVFFIAFTFILLGLVCIVFGAFICLPEE